MNSCSSIGCRITEFLANVKCPHCFSKKVTPCDKEDDEKGRCELCGCEFDLNPEIPAGGME
jgi:hypothetical protein